MKIINKIAALSASLLLSVVSILLMIPSTAHAATKTWVGGGTNTNGVYSMSAANNWSGGAPVAGDDLVFSNGAASNSIENDFPAGTSFNSISFTGSGMDYIITGAAIDLVNGISCSGSQSGFLYLDITLTGSQTFQTGANCGIQYSSANDLNALNLGSNVLTLSGAGGLYMNGVISGTGSIIATGTSTFVRFTAANTYSGTTTVQTGAYLFIDDSSSLGATSSGTTVEDGATLGLAKTNGDMNVAEPITVAGSGVVSTGNYTGYGGSFSYGSSGAGPVASNRTLTLSGTLTLTGDVAFALIGENNTINLTGNISGSYYIDLLKGGYKSSKLVINSTSNGSKTPNGTYYSDMLTVTIADSQPSGIVYVSDNTEYIINGTRGDTIVQKNGVLKGTGTVAKLDVQSGGTVAPGNSPGCLNAGNTTFVSGSNFDVELGGTVVCGGYDQLNVTGTVDLGSATLNTSLYGGFTPKAGDTFIIVKNDGSDAIAGTFSGLAEGATVTVNGVNFKITYKGGDGNDVVLTVLSVPATPNTGFAQIGSNPLATLIMTSVLAGTILTISRKYRSITK